MSTTNPPNTNCVVTGLPPGVQPAAVIGPFDTPEEAQAHATQHTTENPTVPVMATTLINPANC